MASRPAFRSALFAAALGLAAASAAEAVTVTITKAGVGTGTVGTLPDGLMCGQGCTVQSRAFAAGTEIHLVARPAPGSDFAGWSGGCTGLAPGCTRTLGADLAVTATFRERTDLAGCGSAAPFAHAPTDLSAIVAIVPLGNFNPDSGHVLPTRHIYFYQGPPVVPIYAPATGVITGVRAEWRDTPSWSGYDYEFDLSPCKEVRGMLIHVQELAPELLAALGPAGWCDPSAGTCIWTNLAVPVIAGQPLAVAGRTGSPSFGMEAYDWRSPALGYANPARSLPEWIHTVCPLDLFTNTLAADPGASWLQLRLGSLLGSYDGAVRRTGAGACGAVMQDLPGTGQGNWYLDSGPPSFFEDVHLALAHDNVDPRIPVLSVRYALDGTAAGVPPAPPDGRLAAGAYTFSLYPFAGTTNLDWSRISPAERRVYCYEKIRRMPAVDVPETVILVQMPAADLLLVKKIRSWGCEAARLAGLWNDGPSPKDLTGAVAFRR